MPKLASRRALPERYRLLRNIDEGYEIQSYCKVHNRDEWMKVVGALHILAPVKVSRFTVEPVEYPDCPGGVVSGLPDDDVLSRRPAASGGESR